MLICIGASKEANRPTIKQTNVIFMLGIVHYQTTYVKKTLLLFMDQVKKVMCAI
jgi:hypothetical protein